MPKLNKNNSIVDYLKSIGEDSSFSARKAIAEKYGISNYRGTAEQNKQLLGSYTQDSSANKESDNNVELDVKKALSHNDLKKLQEAVQKYGQKEVFDKLKSSGKYDEIVARLKTTRNIQSNFDKETISDRSGTDKLVDENKPESTIFPQYEPFNISDEERGNIEEVQKSYYEPYFDRQRQRKTDDYNVDKSAIERLIGYSKTDTARDLAKINSTFAKTMSKAAKLYGRRNVLGSGIMKQDAQEAVGDLSKDEYNRNEYARRQEEGLEDRKANIKTTFDRGLTDIDENQDAQTYFDTLKEIQNRSNEYNRQFQQSQENTDFNTTTPTTPTNAYTGTDSNKKALNSNYR